MMNPTRHEDPSPSFVNNDLIEERLKRYSSIDLNSFTSDFSESNCIGSGGFAVVYKGLFPDGELRAVKVLDKNNFVEDTFMAEVHAMGKTAHRNLVKFYGYCFEDNMKALVYEYMEYKSLDKILFENHHGNIEWVKLYDIAIDIAKGLKYLHHELEEQIIHYDIKPANVLLGKNFSAKLADFGLAKIMNQDVSRFDGSNIRGTYGYMAPEIYNPGSQVSRKCDVYSFGMMLFEILGKRKNDRGENWFPGLVWSQVERGNLEHFMKEYCDIEDKNKENASRLCKVALWCVQDTPGLRPSMENVVLMLENDKLVEDPPCPSSEFKQPFTPNVDLEMSRGKNVERELSDKMEHGPTNPQNFTVGPTNESVAESDGRVIMQQLESNKCKTQSPNVLKDDSATLVPNKGMKFSTPDLVGKRTALKYKDIILQWIAKKEVVTIGVHGMGGAGKTTILKHVHNHLLVKPNRFDKIIWVTAPKDGNINKLQDNLAKELGFRLSSDDDEDRKSRLLLQALERSKRFVLFIDDMWREISLDKIGIPQPTQENGCKLLIATRKFEVCRRMECQENTIKVKPLLEDEALELFMKTVGVLTPKVRKIAEMVAKKCSGLPLAINTVGGTMKGNSDIGEWRVALNDLNINDPSNRTMDIEDKVNECLKFSYNRLENEKQRKCFLCCVLYPEDRAIEARDLVNFWIMDGIVEGRNRQDEIDRGMYILKKLKDHCLLETDEFMSNEYDVKYDGVKMHDLIRDMALRLTNKCFMIKNGQSFKELPNEEEWDIVLERASFIDNAIKTISISPICPNLSSLNLGSSNILKSVTHGFFVNMTCLKILDFRCSLVQQNNFLELLPDSISDLVNLRVLRLSWYRKLKKLPSLAKLVLLRRLELNDTGIEELPEGMEMLVNLRCLNLHGVELKKRIPKGLISKFPLLQELYLGDIKVDKVYEFGRGESFARELLSLKELENLSVNFHCWSDYASYVGSSKFNGLTCFLLAFSQRIVLHNQYLHPDSQGVIQLFGNDVFNSEISRRHLLFPENTQRVEMFWSHFMKRLSELGWLMKDVRGLVAFSICLCLEIECIWSSKDENQEFSDTGTSSTCWLRCLEMIKIDKCSKLYTIFEGIPISSSVFCLKVLRISKCNNLKNVFPSSRLLQLLPNLEEIVIQNCDELEELIGDEKENTETTIAIPRLKNLWITDLPKLKRIWRGAMVCDSLQHLGVNNCFELKRLPHLMGEEQLTPPQALQFIGGSREWWGSLEWDPVYPKNILDPFFMDEEEAFNSISEWEKRSELDEPALEGAGIDFEKGYSLHPSLPMAFCDNCEICLRGEWYKCKDCWEERVVSTDGYIGFDLCQECYNTPSKHSDYVNQHHTKGHTLMLYGEVSSMSEGEKSSQSEKCTPEGPGNHSEECHSSDPTMICCDNCKIYPVVGLLYKCKICWEERFLYKCKDCWEKEGGERQ